MNDLHGIGYYHCSRLFAVNHRLKYSVIYFILFYKVLKRIGFTIIEGNGKQKSREKNYTTYLQYGAKLQLMSSKMVFGRQHL